MDKLFIHNLKISTIIGVYPWEQKIKQTIALDLEIAIDVAHVAKADNIENALDYAQIAQSVTDFVEQQQCQLIETLAEKISQHLFANHAITMLKLTLYKFGAIANASHVGICIERENN